MIKISIICLLLCAITACQKQAPPSIPEKDTAAPDIQPIAVRTLLSHQRDSVFSTTDTASDFDVRDTIHGLIRTEHARDGMALEGRWYYLNTGQKIAENSARLAAGTNLSHFDLINANPWPHGKYKLFVLVDSIIKDSAEFSVENKR